MDRAQADRQLKKSQELYRAKDFQNALDLLDTLPEKYRRSKQVQYARGLCLVRLDRADEAQDIYNDLADDFPADRLEKLRGRIAALRAAEKASRTSSFMLAGEDPAPAPKKSKKPAPPPEPAEADGGWGDLLDEPDPAPAADLGSHPPLPELPPLPPLPQGGAPRRHAAIDLSGGAGPREPAPQKGAKTGAKTGAKAGNYKRDASKAKAKPAGDPGWLAVIGGGIRSFFADLARQIGARIVKAIVSFGGVALLLGGIFLYDHITGKGLWSPENSGGGSGSGGGGGAVQAPAPVTEESQMVRYEGARSRIVFSHPPTWLVQENAPVPNLLRRPALGSAALSSESAFSHLPELSAREGAAAGGPMQKKVRRRGQWRLSGAIVSVVTAQAPTPAGERPLDRAEVLAFANQTLRGPEAAGAAAEMIGFGWMDALDEGEIVSPPEVFDLNGRVTARYILRGRMAGGAKMILREADVFDSTGLVMMATAMYPEDRAMEFEAPVSVIFGSLTTLPPPGAAPPPQ